MRLKLGFAIAATTILFATPASAQLVDGTGWQTFSWSGLGPVTAPWGTFTFSPSTTSVVQVVDCCIIGDRFTLSWTGTSSGFFTTSDPSANNGTSSGAAGGDASWADGRLSEGSAAFGPGSYNFTLSTITLASGGDCPSEGTCTSGGGYLQATSTVPEPASMTLLATGLVGMVGAGMKRRRTKA